MKWFNRCLVASEDEKRKRSSQVGEKGVWRVSLYTLLIAFNSRFD
jgi:hypothetical protein